MTMRWSGSCRTWDVSTAISAAATGAVGAGEFAGSTPAHSVLTVRSIVASPRAYLAVVATERAMNDLAVTGPAESPACPALNEGIGN